MTDRHIAFTVTLERETRDDDSQRIIEAIRMVRGVASVVPIVADAGDYWARDSARRDLLRQYYEILSKEP